MKVQYRVFFALNQWCAETVNTVYGQYVQGWGANSRDAITNMKDKVANVVLGRNWIDYEQID